MNVKGNIIKGNIKLPAITVQRPSPSQSYLTAARYFFPGIRTLSQGGPDLAIACTFLAAQALECVLKAYLSNAGTPVTELKKKRSYGHNLESLWVGAAHKGLAVPPQPPDWCVILNQTHNEPYYLRYPIGINAFQYPAFSVMVPELSKLIDLVGSIVK
jgi:hypothetical protein